MIKFLATCPCLCKIFGAGAKHLSTGLESENSNQSDNAVASREIRLRDPPVQFYGKVLKVLYECCYNDAVWTGFKNRSAGVGAICSILKSCMKVIEIGLAGEDCTSCFNTDSLEGKLL